MRRILGVALLLSIAYLLLFATPLRLEPVLKPTWAQNLANPIQRPQGDDAEHIPFHVGNVFGFVTPDGAVRYLNTVQFGLALGRDRFINFSSVSTNLVMKDGDGRIVASFAEHGYPMFLSGRLIVVSTSRTALSERDAEGNLVWTRELGSIVTCVSASKDLLAVGLLDGTVEVLDRSGGVAWSYTPGGSKLAAVYGCALAPDGRLLAIASGLDPQRVVILARNSSGFHRIRELTLGEESRARIFMHLFDRIPYLFVERPGSLMYVPTGFGRPGSLPVPNGTITDVAARADGSLQLTALRPDDATADLWLLEPPDRVIGRLAFSGKALSATGAGNALYVGVDRELLRIDVLER